MINGQNVEGISKSSHFEVSLNVFEKFSKIHRKISLFNKIWGLEIACRLAAPTKVFLQLEHNTDYYFISKINIRGDFLYLEMLLVASNTHILTPLFCALWKIVNDSKSFVPAVPMIMSFKVLKYFFSGEISFFLFLLACGLW